MKIPVFLPVTREFGLRDEFAQDCLLQRGVWCEPRREHSGAALPAPAATVAPVTPTTLPNAIRSRSRSIGRARRALAGWQSPGPNKYSCSHGTGKGGDSD